MLKKLILLLFASGCGASISPVSPNVGSGVLRPNAAMANEFLALNFQTETGNTVRGLLKYDAPVRVSIDPALARYRRDLEDVLQNIRRGAGIDIAISSGAGAQIHVQQISAATMERRFPTAACVVASGVRNMAGYRRGDSVPWASQTRLSDSTVFIPDDAPPYIVRACLNEEIGQALGPVNDLFYVADSIFNDDNIHNRLTDFDLLMLRALYDDRMVIGMSRADAAAIIGSILADLNPSGQISGPQRLENPQWKRQIIIAMTPSNRRGARVAAAQQAIAIARGLGDHRLIHSLLVYGRLNFGAAPQIAAPAFREAYTVSLAQLGPDNLRTAVSAMHIAAVALAAQQYEDVLSLTATPIIVAGRQDDPVLLSGLLGLRSLALRALGRDAAAERARLDSLAQARYAFGDDAARISSTQAQLAGLVPAAQ